MSRIRLLFVLTQPVRAGAEEVVLALLHRLDRREFQLALACPAALLDLMPEVRATDVETFPVGAQSWTQPREVARLARALQRFRPDLVNPHLFRSALVSAPLAKWLGVPRVVETYHGREAWRRGPVKGCFVVDRAVAHWVDRFIAVSEAARDFLVRGKRVPAEKVVVVPNGRDLSVFSPGHAAAAVRKELGLSSEVPVIGVLARLESQKGHAFVLEALPSVLREFPDARLLLVGDGSLRSELERHAVRRGISGHVLFAGFRTDVPRVLDAMDLVVLPSLYEGMPLAAIEAGAMAKPVVATQVDGTPEVVRDGVTGRLVPPRDAAALADAIRAVLRDPRQARQFGEAGRQHVRACFDLDTQIGVTARVYREVAGCPV